MIRTDLLPRLHAAVAARCPAELLQLLTDQGLVAMAGAPSASSPRFAADTLSLLPTMPRDALQRHLPGRLRARPARPGVIAEAPAPSAGHASWLERMVAGLRRHTTGAGA
jgi:hypothetical protein